MTRQTVLRVVGGASPSTIVDPNKSALITTTDPAAFQARFADQLGKSVFVCDNGPDALAVLASKSIDLVFADFRELSDKWNGQRFLKHVRSDSKLANIQFYLMANSWFSHQEQWVTKCGALGFVKRTPDVLAQHILTGEVLAKANEPAELDIIDGIFGAFSGPMRRMHIEQARDAFNNGQIEPTLESYITDLACKLVQEDRREQFSTAASAAVAIAAVSKKKLDETDADWMAQVDDEFKRFAGALAYRLVVPGVHESRRKSGNHEKSYYVERLADSLSNPSRRSEFYAALKRLNLID